MPPVGITRLTTNSSRPSWKFSHRASFARCPFTNVSSSSFFFFLPLRIISYITRFYTRCFSFFFPYFPILGLMSKRWISPVWSNCMKNLTSRFFVDIGNFRLPAKISPRIQSSSETSINTPTFPVIYTPCITTDEYNGSFQYNK